MTIAETVMVGQPGLEHVPSPTADEHSHASALDAPTTTPETARKPLDADGSGPAIGPVDAIEAALANALEAATIAGRFDIVAQLARELEARRLSRVTNVVMLASPTKRLTRDR